MLDTLFALADCFVHLHSHARPSELVLQNIQHLLLSLVSRNLVTFIHSSHSMSCGEYILHNISQLTCQCKKVIEGSLIEHQLFPLSKDGHSLLSVHVICQEMLQILYFLIGDPIDNGLKYWIFSFSGHPISHV